MKKEKVKVGMVVKHKTEGYGRVTVKANSEGYGWMSSMESHDDGWSFHVKNLRPLTARERGDTQ